MTASEGEVDVVGEIWPNPWIVVDLGDNKIPLRQQRFLQPRSFRPRQRGSLPDEDLFLAGLSLVEIDALQTSDMRSCARNRIEKEVRLEDAHAIARRRAGHAL